MKLGYFPYVLYRDFDSTRRDDVEGLALVALADDVRAVELVPVLIKGSRRWRQHAIDARPRLGRGSSLLVHGTGQFRQLGLRDAVRQRARRPHEVSVLVELDLLEQLLVGESSLLRVLGQNRAKRTSIKGPGRALRRGDARSRPRRVVHERQLAKPATHAARADLA